MCENVRKRHCLEMWIKTALNKENSLKQRVSKRRRRDSNPRYSYPYTCFPSKRHRPLGHLSIKCIPYIGDKDKIYFLYSNKVCKKLD